MPYKSHYVNGPEYAGNTNLVSYPENQDYKFNINAGISVDVASIIFDNTDIGSKSSYIFSITNTGNAPLVINNIDPGSSSIFSISPILSNIIAVGSNLLVEAVFKPLAAQSYTGQFTINSNAGTKVVSLSGTGVAAAAPNISIDKASLNFGNATVGANPISQIFTISNTGNAPLTISISTNSGAFTTGSYPTSVPPNTSVPITIYFSPTSAGSFTGTATINSNAGTKTVSLTGTGITAAAPVMYLPTTSIDFGNVNVGGSATKYFEIKNTGTAPLTINMTCNNPAFIVPPSATIQAGVSVSPSVIFTPTSGQAYSGTITINSNAGTKTVSLSGIGIGASAPQIAFSTQSVNFGEVPLGWWYEYSPVEIKNIGNANLIINNVSLKYYNTIYSDVFSYTKSFAQEPFVITPGNKQFIYPKYTPNFRGEWNSAYISISTNIGNYDIGLSGHCVRYTPQIKQYSSCEARYIDGYNYEHGIISAQIYEVNYANNYITFRVVRCDNTPLKTSGSLYITSDPSSSQAITWAPVNFSANSNYADITIIDNSLKISGAKTYYAITYQAGYGSSISPMMQIFY